MILNARNVERLEALKTEIERAWGRRVLLLPFDVRDRVAARAAVESLSAEWQGIDVLINNAGLALGLDKEYEGNEADYDTMIETNITALLMMTRLVVPGMVARGKGHIINIGSVDGETGGAVDYAAEKSGLTYGLTKALARIGAPYGVRCCAVSPGPVLTRAAMSNMKTALGRAAEPIEIVKLVMYLCSDDAAFITGTNYNIEGGRVLLNNA